jgi:hypothetical protein
MKSMIFEHYSLAGEWDGDNHECFRATLTEKSVDTLNSRVYCLETVPGGQVFWKEKKEQFGILLVRDQRMQWHKLFLDSASLFCGGANSKAWDPHAEAEC